MAAVALVAWLAHDPTATAQSKAPMLGAATRPASGTPAPRQPSLPTGCTAPTKTQCADTNWYKADRCVTAPATKQAMLDYCTWVFMSEWHATPGRMRTTLFPTSAPDTVYPIIAPARSIARGKNVDPQPMNRPMGKRYFAGTQPPAGGRSRATTTLRTASWTPVSARSGGGSYASMATNHTVSAMGQIDRDVKSLQNMTAADPGARMKAEQIFSALTVKPQWAMSPGAVVASCEEYAYKRWGEYSAFSSAAKRLGRNWREVYNIATDPSSPVFVNKQLMQTATSTPIPVQLNERLTGNHWDDPNAKPGDPPKRYHQLYLPANAFFAMKPTWLSKPGMPVTPAQKQQIDQLIAARWNVSVNSAKAVFVKSDNSPLGIHREAKARFDSVYGNPHDDELADISKRTKSYHELLARRAAVLIELPCASANDPCFKCSAPPKPGTNALPGALQKLKDKITGDPVINPGDVMAVLEPGNPAQRLRSLAVFQRLGAAFGELERGIGNTGGVQRSNVPQPGPSTTSPQPQPQPQPGATRPQPQPDPTTRPQPQPVRPGMRPQPQPQPRPIQPRPMQRRPPMQPRPGVQSPSTTVHAQPSPTMQRQPMPMQRQPRQPAQRVPPVQRQPQIQSNRPPVQPADQCLADLVSRKSALEAELALVETLLTKHLVNELQYGKRGCLDDGDGGVNICDWSYELFASELSTLLDADVENSYRECRTEVAGAAQAANIGSAGAFNAVLRSPPKQALVFPCVQRRDFTMTAPEARRFMELNGNYLARACEAYRQTVSVQQQQNAIADEMRGFKWKPTSGEIYDDAIDSLVLGKREVLGAYFDYGASWKLKKNLPLANNGDEMSTCRYEGNASSKIGAGIYFFGDDLSLFKLDGAGSARTEGNQPKTTVSASSYYFDIETYEQKRIFNDQNRSIGNDTYAPSTPPSINLGGGEVDFWVTIGPIPIHITFGAVASAGIDYKFAGSPGNNCGNLNGPTGFRLVSTIEPFVRADAYAEASVDVVVASAGVRLDLLLMRLGIPLGVDIANTSGSSWQFHNGGRITIDMLSGRLTGYVEVGVAPLEESWEAEIFAWDGFHFDVASWGLDKTLPNSTVRVAMASYVSPGNVKCACEATFCCSALGCPNNNCPGSKFADGAQRVCTFSAADAQAIATMQNATPQHAECRQFVYP